MHPMLELDERIRFELVNSADEDDGLVEGDSPEDDSNEEDDMDDSFDTDEEEPAQ